MLYGIAIIKRGPTGKPVLVPIEHNLPPDIQVKLLADLRTNKKADCMGFTHALMHDLFVDPGICTACEGALGEALKIVNESSSQRRTALPVTEATVEAPPAAPDSLKRTKVSVP